MKNPRFRLLPFVSVLLLVCGCSTGPSTSERIRYYILEYQSPEIANVSGVDAVVRVDRFTATSPYNQAAIVYRDKAYRQNSYYYERWRVSPPDMMSDFVARDLRNAGIFRAVLRYQAPGRARFHVEGDILKFEEVDRPDGWFAVAELNVTLTDMRSRDSSTWVVWQKNYRYSEPCTAKDPEHVVQAMSRAVEALSRALTADVRDGIRGRLEKNPKEPVQPADGKE